jgi:hypothetical protein
MVREERIQSYFSIFMKKREAKKAISPISV